MTDTKIATEIYRQLGGHRFAVMTGAKHLTATSENTLTFSLPGGGGFCKDGINQVRITLDTSDTYSIEFNRIRAGKVKQVAAVQDVYADSLRAIFTRYTCLATSL